MLWPNGFGTPPFYQGDGIDVSVKVEGIQVVKGKVVGAEYKIPNVSHNGMVIATTGYTGTDVQNRTNFVRVNSNANAIINFALQP